MSLGKPIVFTTFVVDAAPKKLLSALCAAGAGL